MLRFSEDAVLKKREPWTPLLKSFPESRKINSVSLGAECMFIRLVALCDDHANYYGEPRLLLVHLFGNRYANGTATERDCIQWRTELVTAGLVEAYLSGGETYLRVANCKKHLRADINEDIRFPEFAQAFVIAKDTESVPDTVRGRTENVSPYSSSSSSSSSSSDSKKEGVSPTGNDVLANTPKAKKKRPIQPDPTIPPELNTPEFVKAWTDWLEHLRQKRSKPTSLAITRQLGKCQKVGVARAVAMIEHSMTSNWQSLFEPSAGATNVGTRAARRGIEEIPYAGANESIGKTLL